MASREAQELTIAKARLRHIGWLLVGWTALGTVANWATRERGPWDAFIFTIDTLAYLAPRQQGVAWFIQVVLLHGGTVITWYIGWYLVDLVLDKHLWRNLREARRMKTIESLSNHVIVCGGGRVGAHLATQLARAGVPFVVIEQDPDRAAELRENDWAVLDGEAHREEALREAGIARARRVIAALPVAERNVLVVLAGKRARADVAIDARCEDESLVGALEQAGAARVVLPERACADVMMAALETASPALRA